MADQRIQYSEEMVGANHATKSDTLNRLALIDHNNDGTHKNPSFHVHNNAVDLTLITGAGTVLTWSTAEFDTHTGFSSTKYTPSVAGKYLLSAAVTIKTPQSTLISVSIRKNGTVYKSCRFDGTGTTNKTLNVTCVASANGTTDYFDVSVYQESGSSKSTDGTASETYYSGCRIDG
ncbi:MAG: hypothetical protein AABZ23_06415 [Deltaproteobacteria bacterium]|mgnify:CR=1 FL=1